MEKSDTGKPKRYPTGGELDYRSLANKYLEGYNNALLTALAPVDIEGFVADYLQLNILNATMKLPFVKGFIVYMQMYFDTDVSSCRISVDPGTIILNTDLNQNAIAKRYVLAHEAGHWILNREKPCDTHSYYSCCKSFLKRADLLDAEKVKDYFDHEPDAWSETRADSMANALLMPAGAFTPLATELMGQHGLHTHRMIVGECPDVENTIIQELAAIFVVPEFAVRNYLYTLGMYENSNCG